MTTRKRVFVLEHLHFKGGSPAFVGVFGTTESAEQAVQRMHPVCKIRLSKGPDSSEQYIIALTGTEVSYSYRLTRTEIH